MAVYITGDTHGRFDGLKKFCKEMNLTKDDTIIILGDAGFNYYLDDRDTWGKKKVRDLAPTILCVHGNHECRPRHIKSYVLAGKFGGEIYVEPNYPNIGFLCDGQVYNIPSKDGTVHDVLVCGGAYSVDKYYRLSRGFSWFPDEQPDATTKEYVEEVLDKRNWEIDDIFTHTGPVSLEPVEMFLLGIDQSKVDKTTEIWFEDILNKLKSFKQWWFGHYHCNKIVNEQVRILFNEFVEF